MEQSKKLFEKLQTSLTSLADALDCEVPELPEDKREEESMGALALVGPDGRQEFHSGGPFDDEDTRSFYEDLPNLLDVVPRQVLGLSEKEYAELREAQEGAADSDPVKDEEDQGEVAEEGAETDETTHGLEEEEIEETLDAEQEIESEDVTENTTNDDPAENYSSPFDLYLAQFDDMVNRERCDKAAIDFFYVGTGRRAATYK